MMRKQRKSVSIFFQCVVLLFSSDGTVFLLLVFAFLPVLSFLLFLLAIPVAFDVFLPPTFLKMAFALEMLPNTVHPFARDLAIAPQSHDDVCHIQVESDGHGERREEQHLRKEAHCKE